MKDELSLVEQTQQNILRYISENKPTSLPKEEEFAAILGVSRVALREALSRLRAMGFIETKRKIGTVVVQPEVFGVMKSIVASGLLDKDTLRDLYELRIMLEIGAADFIFKNKTDEQMSSLEKIVGEEYELDEKMHAAENDEQRLEIAKQLTEIDIQFHSTLFEMTGNHSLMDFQYILRHLFTLYFPRIKKDFHEMNVISHIGLYNLLRTGNPDTFRIAMRLHLQTQIMNMEFILEQTRKK